MKRRVSENFPFPAPEKRVKQEELESFQEGSCRGRQDNSLGVLTRKFLQLIREDANLEMDLNDSVRLLKV